MPTDPPHPPTPHSWDSVFVSAAAWFRPSTKHGWAPLAKADKPRACKFIAPTLLKTRTPRIAPWASKNARWVIFSQFLFEGLGHGLNAREFPNQEDIGLVMFIFIVDLVESKISFWVLVTFLASAVRGPSPHKGPLLACVAWRAVVCCWCWCLLLHRPHHSPFSQADVFIRTLSFRSGRVENSVTIARFGNLLLANIHHPGELRKSNFACPRPDFSTGLPAIC